MPRSINLHATSLQGMRTENEDAEEYILNLGENGLPLIKDYCPIDFFAICDGHGGDRVAKLVIEKLKYYFTKKELNYPLTHSFICKIFHTIQTDIQNTKYKNEYGHVESIGDDCGCTALIVVRFYNYSEKKEYVQVINLGDCRAVLCNRYDFANALTIDHKPFFRGERKRIENVNKTVDEPAEIMYYEGDWRVNGISVSRSFGDNLAKPQISHKPDSFVYPLHNDDKYIVMACDGLWDVLENHFVTDFITENMFDDGGNKKFYLKHVYPPSKDVKNANNIARKLANYAIHAKGSGDNVSVFIIFFE